MNENQLSHEIIGAALKVHRALGPGLLESAYEECLAREFSIRDIAYQRQVLLPIEHKGTAVDAGYRLDFIVANLVVLELKAVGKLLAIHEAQVLTYLKLSGRKLGLLMNFNTVRLSEGIQRIVLNLDLEDEVPAKAKTPSLAPSPPWAREKQRSGGPSRNSFFASFAPLR